VPRTYLCLSSRPGAAPSRRASGAVSVAVEDAQAVAAKVRDAGLPEGYVEKLVLAA
jgi:hypothetical protein